MVYLFLALSIISETIATTSLKASAGFTKLVPSILVIVGYGVAFLCMSIVMKSMPVGIVYAIWSGIGIVLVSVMSYFWYKQTLDLPAIIGMVLIIAGVAVINLFSKAAVH
ncbi:MAG TPA: multidrug efflux SMR transporter [Bdellovibrio sp.]|uniref:DMT family transporter n=1 Tax=Bdellovibrio sp. TaxID=28201 RepID=UPI002F1627A7